VENLTWDNPRGTVPHVGQEKRTWDRERERERKRAQRARKRAAAEAPAAETQSTPAAATTEQSGPSSVTAPEALGANEPQAARVESVALSDDKIREAARRLCEAGQDATALRGILPPSEVDRLAFAVGMFLGADEARNRGEVGQKRKDRMERAVRYQRWLIKEGF
jgi:hypothetical protein